MKVINLFGGPGTGKSTTAAALFAAMKYEGKSVELVTEYAKDKVWERSMHTLDNQLYVFAKQYHRMWRISDQVEYCVTDSPLLMSAFYGASLSKAFLTLVEETHSSWPSLNIFLRRVKPYQKLGRYQDEEQARAIDDAIYKQLWGVTPIHSLNADTDAVDNIRDIMQEVFWKEFD